MHISLTNNNYFEEPYHCCTRFCHQGSNSNIIVINNNPVKMYKLIKVITMLLILSLNTIIAIEHVLHHHHR